DQQLTYLATRRWARRFAPSAMLGVYTADEWYEAANADRPKQKTADNPISSIKARLNGDDPAHDFETGEIIDAEIDEESVATDSGSQKTEYDPQAEVPVTDEAKIVSNQAAEDLAVNDAPLPERIEECNTDEQRAELVKRVFAGASSK